MEGLDQLKKSYDLIGTRTRDLPACTTVPQPTTLWRAPNNLKWSFHYKVSTPNTYLSVFSQINFGITSGILINNNIPLESTQTLKLSDVTRLSAVE
jgi:hypothetical protein